MPAALTRRRLAAGLALAVAGPALAEERIAAAPPGAVRVLASTGIRAVLEPLVPEAEKALGRPVVVRFGASRALQAVIESGQPFEVAVVTPEVIDAAVARGAVLGGSRRDLARVAVAIGQRGGTRGDLSSPAGLKALLSGAKAIRINPIGAGQPTAARLWAGVGVDPASLGDRVRPLPTAADPPASLGPGEYELTIALDSEMASLAPVAVNLGAIPAPYQVPVVLSAGLGAKGDATAAQAFVAWLQSPALARALAANRMSRVGGEPAPLRAPS